MVPRLPENRGANQPWGCTDDLRDFIAEIVGTGPDPWNSGGVSTVVKDGKLIYYKNGTLAYSIRIVDHQTESVADLSGISTTGNTGHWFAVDPDGSPLALRDLSLNEIYALDFEAP